MDYQTTKRTMMEAYPTLFVCEADVLDHLFFVIGGGYHWEKGELIDDDSPEECIAFAREDREHNIKRHIEWAKEEKDEREIQYWERYLEETLLPIEEQWERERKKRKKYYEDERMRQGLVKLPSGEITGHIYPICEYSRILTLPENIHKDWLDAAKKALELAPLLEPTKRDKEHIKQAWELWSERYAEWCQLQEDGILNCDDG